MRFTAMTTLLIANYLTYRIYPAILMSIFVIIIVGALESLRMKVVETGVEMEHDERMRELASELRVCMTGLDVFNILTVITWASMMSYATMLQILPFVSVACAFVAGGTFAIVFKYENAIVEKKVPEVTLDTPL